MIKIPKSNGLFFKVLEISSSRLFKIQRIQNLPGDVKRLYWGWGGWGESEGGEPMWNQKLYLTRATQLSMLQREKEVGFEVLRLNLNSKLSGYVTFRQVAKAPEI